MGAPKTTTCPNAQSAVGSVRISNRLKVGTLVGWVVLVVVVWKVYNPDISQNFLLVYFSISSALAVAVWSALRTVSRQDEMIVAGSLFFSLAAVTAAPALLLPPGGLANLFLTGSIASLLLGILLLFVDSYAAWFRAS